MLEHLCQEFRIITVDPRGTGHSDPQHAGYGTCDHAADIRAVIEAAGVGPVTAIGISKSSSILIRLADTAPALVKRLMHLPDARLYLFEGRGRLPIFTATTEFCDVLRRFVTTGEVAAD